MRALGKGEIVHSKIYMVTTGVLGDALMVMIAYGFLKKCMVFNS